jgi:hypothetical protein
VIRNRWVRVGLVALGIFVINALARLISRLTQDDTVAVDPTASTGVDKISLLGAGAVVLFMAVMGALWAVRHPFSRMVFDLGAAVIGGALLALLVAPFVGGSKPFDEGLGTFVGELLQFIGLGALGVLLGFLAMIVFGKDWKSRGLRRYEENYKRKTHKIVRR